MIQAILIKFLLNQVLDAVFEYLLEAAKEHVNQTSNEIDDGFVKVFEDNKDSIKEAVRVKAEDKL